METFEKLNKTQNSVRLNHINRAEKRITWMVAVMIIAFILAWTPYAVFALIKQFGPTDYIGPGMAVLPALIAKSSICYNPIIYVGMNTQVGLSFGNSHRQKLKQLIQLISFFIFAHYSTNLRCHRRPHMC